jgi:hypothetical protein
MPKINHRNDYAQRSGGEGIKNAINNCQNLVWRFYYKRCALADPEGFAKHRLKITALTALE